MLGSVGLGLGSVGTAAEPGGAGGEPPGDDTLANIYAAGLGSPTTDNLFNMQLGTTLRFQANSDAQVLPEVALFEGTAAQAVDTSGRPAFVESLATTLATLIGGRVFNAFQMFDPAWNGQWSKLDAYSWTIETVSFVNGPQTTWTIGTNAAARSYQAAKNYSPQGWPFFPGNQDAAFHQLFLYNGANGFSRQVDRLDGFGQMTRVLSPVNAGITYQWQTRFNKSPPAIGDGTGWAVFQSSGFGEIGDPPLALLKAYLTSDGATWGWGLSSKSGPSTEFDIAKFEQQGITFNAPVTQLGGGLAVSLALSADVDLTTTGTYPITPSLPGYYGYVFRTGLVLTAVTGTVSAGPTVNMGNNGSLNNFSTSNAIAPLQFTLPPPATVAGPAFNVGAGNTMIDLTTPIQVQVTAPATGASVVRGKFALWIAYVPVAVFT